MTDWIEKLTAPHALPLGISTVAWNDKNDYITCTTKFVCRHPHIVSESIFRVVVGGHIICITPYLDIALSRFENPELVTE